MTQLPEPAPESVPSLELVARSSRRVGRRAPGRDRGHQQPARPRQVKLRVSDDEYATIAGAARDAGLTPSGYAAEAALAAAAGTHPPSTAPWRTALAELIETRTQVRRLGTNINQVARALNADGEAPPWLDRAAITLERTVQRLDLSATALLAAAGDARASEQHH